MMKALIFPNLSKIRPKWSLFGGFPFADCDLVKKMSIPPP